MRELAATDARQPAAEVVVVGQLGGGNAVWCPDFQAAQVIVGAGHEGYLRSAAGLELGGQQSPRMVVCVAVNLGLHGFAGGRSLGNHNLRRFQPSFVCWLGSLSRRSAP